MQAIYYSLLFLTIILTFRIFLIDKVIFPFKVLNNNINTALQSFLKTPLVFETGQIDILTIISIIFFFLLGYLHTKKPFQVVIFLVIFESFIIFGKGSGRILTLLTVSLLSYSFGYFFGKRRNRKEELRKYSKNR